MGQENAFACFAEATKATSLTRAGMDCQRDPSDKTKRKAALSCLPQEHAAHSNHPFSAS